MPDATNLALTRLMIAANSRRTAGGREWQGRLQYGDALFTLATPGHLDGLELRNEGRFGQKPWFAVLPGGTYYRGKNNRLRTFTSMEAAARSVLKHLERNGR